jgi:ribosomal protein S18 acetylase RimI-like enzyme
VIAHDVIIESYLPPVTARGPLTPKQAQELAALNDILAHGDGLLRIARVGATGVGRALVFVHITAAVEQAVLGASGTTLGPRLRAGRSALLTDLVVVETHRRRGVGAQLVRDACAIARSTGLERLSLEVRRDNVPACRLYERLGFSAAGDGEVVVYSSRV